MSTSSGNKAESVATEWLEQEGYTIIERNWRNRWCEIDIIAKNAKTLYFVEVKYRDSNRHGSGLDYITPAKLDQMSFAADLWTKQTSWQGNYELSALEVSGDDFVVTDFVPELI